MEREVLLARNEHETVKRLHEQAVKDLASAEEAKQAQLKHLSEQHVSELSEFITKQEHLSVTLSHRDQALVAMELTLESTKEDLARRKSQLDSIEAGHK